MDGGHFWILVCISCHGFTIWLMWELWQSVYCNTWIHSELKDYIAALVPSLGLLFCSYIGKPKTCLLHVLVVKSTNSPILLVYFCSSSRVAIDPWQILWLKPLFVQFVSLGQGLAFPEQLVCFGPKAGMFVFVIQTQKTIMILQPACLHGTFHYGNVCTCYWCSCICLVLLTAELDSARFGNILEFMSTNLIFLLAATRCQ